jgi:hypothetical protein
VNTTNDTMLATLSTLALFRLAKRRLMKDEDIFPLYNKGDTHAI